ncbi:ATP-dependent Clp protease proteolytic subunit, partial [Rhizobium mongolense]|uniref:ATP-dependent Clp protease proteolytic subunit n=1 Tax=Rhizobium mongolense TaxID=57676 RepID=UPI003557A917
MATAYFYFGKPINADTVTSCITGMRNQLAARPQPGTNFSWDTFHVSIASGGGEVISAFSLFNQMAGMGATIHTHNSGAVDSAALVPFLAGTRSTVAWIRLWTKQPYPLHFSCNALELGPAKFCHPVKNTDTNLCFGLLIVKMSRFEFGPDHSLPSTHLGLSATALVVAGGFLPCHPP